MDRVPRAFVTPPHLREMGDDMLRTVGSPGSQVVMLVEVEWATAMNGDEAFVADGYVRPHAASIVPNRPEAKRHPARKAQVPARSQALRLALTASPIILRTHDVIQRKPKPFRNGCQYLRTPLALS